MHAYWVLLAFTSFVLALFPQCQPLSYPSSLLFPSSFCSESPHVLADLGGSGPLRVLITGGDFEFQYLRDEFDGIRLGFESVYSDLEIEIVDREDYPGSVESGVISFLDEAPENVGVYFVGDPPRRLIDLVSRHCGFVVPSVTLSSGMNAPAYMPIGHEAYSPVAMQLPPSYIRRLLAVLLVRGPVGDLLTLEGASYMLFSDSVFEEDINFLSQARESFRHLRVSPEVMHVVLDEMPCPELSVCAADVVFALRDTFSEVLADTLVLGALPIFYFLPWRSPGSVVALALALLPYVGPDVLPFFHIFGPPASFNDNANSIFFEIADSAGLSRELLIDSYSSVQGNAVTPSVVATYLDRTSDISYSIIFRVALGATRRLRSNIELLSERGLLSRPAAAASNAIPPRFPQYGLYQEYDRGLASDISLYMLDELVLRPPMVVSLPQNEIATTADNVAMHTISLSKLSTEGQFFEARLFSDVGVECPEGSDCRFVFTIDYLGTASLDPSPASAEPVPFGLITFTFDRISPFLSLSEIDLPTAVLAGVLAVDTRLEGISLRRSFKTGLSVGLAAMPSLVWENFAFSETYFITNAMDSERMSVFVGGTLVPHILIERCRFVDLAVDIFRCMLTDSYRGASRRLPLAELGAHVVDDVFHNQTAFGERENFFGLRHRVSDEVAALVQVAMTDETSGPRFDPSTLPGCSKGDKGEVSFECGEKLVCTSVCGPTVRAAPLLVISPLSASELRSRDPDAYVFADDTLVLYKTVFEDNLPWESMTLAGQEAWNASIWAVENVREELYRRGTAYRTVRPSVRIAFDPRVVGALEAAAEYAMTLPWDLVLPSVSAQGCSLRVVCDDVGWNASRLVDELALEAEERSGTVLLPSFAVDLTIPAGTLKGELDPGGSVITAVSPLPSPWDVINDDAVKVLRLFSDDFVENFGALNGSVVFRTFSTATMLSYLAARAVSAYEATTSACVPGEGCRDEVIETMRRSPTQYQGVRIGPYANNCSVGLRRTFVLRGSRASSPFTTDFGATIIWPKDSCFLEYLAPPPPPSTGLSMIAIVFLIIGPCVFLACLVLLAFLLFWRHRRKQRHLARTEEENRLCREIIEECRVDEGRLAILLAEAKERASDRDAYGSAINAAFQGPLGTMRSAIASLQMQTTSADVLEMVGMLAASSLIAKNTIEQVLVVESEISGTAVLHPAAINLADVVEEAALALAPLIIVKGVDLIIDVPADTPLVISDEMRLRQIVFNLLSNAMKFTHEGSITICAKVSPGTVAEPPLSLSPAAAEEPVITPTVPFKLPTRLVVAPFVRAAYMARMTNQETSAVVFGDDFSLGERDALPEPSTGTGVSSAVQDGQQRENFGTVTLIVRDTGIGITEEQHRRLFEPFAQASDGISRLYGGSGLGLTIILRSTEVLGGTFDLAGQDGVGSTGTVTFPVVIAAAAPPRPQLGLRVLYFTRSSSMALQNECTAMEVDLQVCASWGTLKRPFAPHLVLVDSRHAPPNLEAVVAEWESEATGSPCPVQHVLVDMPIGAPSLVPLPAGWGRLRLPLCPSTVQELLSEVKALYS